MPLLEEKKKSLKLKETVGVGEMSLCELTMQMCLYLIYSLIHFK